MFCGGPTSFTHYEKEKRQLKGVDGYQSRHEQSLRECGMGVFGSGITC